MIVARFALAKASVHHLTYNLQIIPSTVVKRYNDGLQVFAFFERSINEFRQKHLMTVISTRQAHTTCTSLHA
jgi:hypothetical protein